MKLSPSSFIPFCEFGGDMSTLGLKINQFSLPVCSSFKAKILNKQLCYEIDLNRYYTKDLLKDGLELGLLLLIDHNKDRQMKSLNYTKIQEGQSLASKFNVINSDGSATISLGTIGR